MPARTKLLSTLVIIMGAGLLGAGGASAAGKPISTETLRDMWRAHPAMVQADALGDYIEDYRLAAIAPAQPKSRPAPETEARTQAAALNRIWRSNPLFARPDELSDYGDDYRATADAGQMNSPVFGDYLSAGFAWVKGVRKEAADRQAELREIWHSDPRFSRADELSDYADDFRATDDPALIVAARTPNQAG